MSLVSGVCQNLGIASGVTVRFSLFFECLVDAGVCGEGLCPLLRVSVTLRCSQLWPADHRSATASLARDRASLWTIVNSKRRPCTGTAVARQRSANHADSLLRQRPILPSFGGRAALKARTGLSLQRRPLRAVRREAKRAMRRRAFDGVQTRVAIRSSDNEPLA